MKRRVWWDEWDVIDVDERNPRAVEVEMPAQQWERWEKAKKEFEACQDMIKALVEAEQERLKAVEREKSLAPARGFEEEFQKRQREERQ